MQCRRFIIFPSDEDAASGQARTFYLKGRFRGVVDAIDCTHKIQSPGGVNTELFCNRKEDFSINVQAVCNCVMQMLCLQIL